MANKRRDCAKMTFRPPTKQPRDKRGRFVSLLKLLKVSLKLAKEKK